MFIQARSDLYTLLFPSVRSVKKPQPGYFSVAVDVNAGHDVVAAVLDLLVAHLHLRQHGKGLR